MKYARGMTLIEVLAATALLALISGVCLPMLIGETRPHAVQEQITIAELALIADRVLEDPAAHGLDLAGGIAPISGSHLRVLSASIPIDIDLQLLLPIELDTDHAWLVFESGGISLSRWVSAETIGVTP